MNVKIQTVHFNADSKLKEYVNRKLEKLTVFSDRIIEVNVSFKLDNVAHSIKDKIAGPCTASQLFCKINQ